MNKKAVLEQIRQEAFDSELDKFAGKKISNALKGAVIAASALGLGYGAHALKDKLYGKNRISIINPRLFGKEANLKDLAALSVKEEINLNRLKKDYGKEYLKRDVGGLLGGALGASVGLSKRLGKFRIPASIAAGTVGLIGGMGAGHAVAKAQNPAFAKAFENATTKYQDSIYDYVQKKSR